MGELLGALKAQLLHAEPERNPAVFWGRVGVFLAFFFWGWSFILMDVSTNEIGQSFMHTINLVFHEAGHVIFRPFGRFLTILGGSIAQLLMPAIVIGCFVFQNRDNFGASLGLWWLGQSFMDLAPYIDDARSLKLMLLGGHTGAEAPGTHDWRNILISLDLLPYDHAIATSADVLGTLIMLTAFLWGGYTLYGQSRRPDSAYPDYPHSRFG
jgi:hypothetical protein